MNQITFYIISAFAVLITLTVHEYFHAYTAYKLGDGTARNAGRLTLNPIKHIDPIGALCMLFFHIGWAKPVPVSVRNLKKPRRDMALISLAGPGANIIMSIFSAFIYLLLISLFSRAGIKTEFWNQVTYNTCYFFYVFHLINIGIALFNLIPIPPLDGSNILATALPPKAYIKYMQYERIFHYILIGWLLLGDFVYDILISVPLIAASQILSGIAKIFSLSGILGELISIVSEAIIKFWSLIPFLNV